MVKPHEDDELGQLTDEQRIYVRKLQNPYAVASIALKTSDSRRNETVAQVEEAASDAPASKAEFESEGRRILRNYIPALEGGRLREHYKSFIIRNASRPGHIRRKILQELARYDLSRIIGFDPHFNREKDPLTEEKLQRIEDKFSEK